MKLPVKIYGTWCIYSKRGKLFVVDNYLEAVGVMNAIKAGVTLESVRRPLVHTTVREEKESQESKSLEKMITENRAG